MRNYLRFQLPPLPPFLPLLLLLLPSLPAPPTAAAARRRRCCSRRLRRAHRSRVFRSPSNDEIRRSPDAGPDPSAEFTERAIDLDAAEDRGKVFRAPYQIAKKTRRTGPRVPDGCSFSFETRPSSMRLRIISAVTTVRGASIAARRRGRTSQSRNW